MLIKISKHNTTVDISKELIDLYSFAYYDDIDCDELVKKDIRTLYDYFYNSDRKKGISGLISRALIHDVYLHYKYQKVRENSCKEIEEKILRARSVNDLHENNVTKDLNATSSFPF